MPLIARNLQLIRARLARAIRAGKRGRSIRRPAADIRHIGQARLSVRDTNNNHAVMQQRRMKAGERCLLPTVLRSSRRENAPDFSDQRTLGP